MFINSNLKKTVNFVSFNCIWAACVYLGNDALFFVFILLLINFLLSPKPLTEFKIVMILALIGYSIDCLLTLYDFFKFEQVQGITPMWLAALWIGFSATLGHSLNFLAGKYALASILGAIFATLSYFTAAHLGAVALPFSSTVSALVLMIIWALLFPALLWLDNALRKRLC